MGIPAGVEHMLHRPDEFAKAGGIVHGIKSSLAPAVFFTTY
jgi:hypothetical protein